ncbi:MAG: DUF402 domain-containing protein [Chloroflexota bacterium]|nr:DUF402 domain-containing protein [Chloroflexota bacterium]MDE3102691.1 DUF402 domain-containing protein [Chloroflexota bacterium]
MDGSVVEFECVPSLVRPGSRAVIRYLIQKKRALEGTSLVLPAGTLTIGHFWVDRPYNVYHWLDGGRTLAYYCSIARDTTVAEDEVAYTDLVVDVLLDPAGGATVLDEDELPPDLAVDDRRTIARALDQLMSRPSRLAAEIESESAPFRGG